MSIKNQQFSQEQRQTLRRIDPTHSKKDPIDDHPCASAMRHHNASLNFNLNIQQTETKEPQIITPTHDETTQLASTIIMLQKEPMFEKPLTPSDVGKLNRLVIPKQHAERYFPLAANYDSLDKALLLSFEDESGKSWRFRYSYWNSSQSYVLTKGWSRFVKEKRLDAGDVVIFLRYPQDGDRFFIGWRRRNAVAPPPVRDIVMPQAGIDGAAGWARLLYNSNGVDHLPYHLPDSCLHLGVGSGGGLEKEREGSGNSKTVRLFGVNLECQAQAATDEISIERPVPLPTAEAFTHYYHNYSNKPPPAS